MNAHTFVGQLPAMIVRTALGTDGRTEDGVASVLRDVTTGLENAADDLEAVLGGDSGAGSASFPRARTRIRKLLVRARTRIRQGGAVDDGFSGDPLEDLYRRFEKFRKAWKLLERAESELSQLGLVA